MDGQEGQRADSPRCRSSSDSVSSDLSALVIEEPPKLQSIPLKDGIDAWKFLLGCSVLEALLWGFALSFGIFEAYYGTHPALRSSSYIPTIGSLSVGLSYLGLPAVNAVALRYPHRQRTTMIIGWLFTIVSLFCAAHATKVRQLMLWQGFAFGLGWVVCYAPFLIMLNEWFDKRRGLAYGILFSASGISGMVIPFMLEKSLQKYGYSVTLQYFALIAFFGSGPFLFVIKHRVPQTRGGRERIDALPLLERPSRGSHETHTKPTYGFLRSFSTLVFMVSLFMQGLVGFLPDTFIPSYAAAISPSSNHGGLIALRSLFQTMGQIGLGHASDVLPPLLPLFINVAVSTVSVVGIWGPAKSTPVLAIFASLWGAFGGSFSVLWYRAVLALTAHQTSSPTESSREGSRAVTMYGWCSFLRGVAMVAGGYVSARLVGTEVDEDLNEFGLGRWKAVVWFCTMALSVSTVCAAVCWVWAIISQRRRETWFDSSSR